MCAATIAPQMLARYCVQHLCLPGIQCLLNHNYKVSFIEQDELVPFYGRKLEVLNEGVLTYTSYLVNKSSRRHSPYSAIPLTNVADAFAKYSECNYLSLEIATAIVAAWLPTAIMAHMGAAGAKTVTAWVMKGAASGAGLG